MSFPGLFSKSRSASQVSRLPSDVYGQRSHCTNCGYETLGKHQTCPGCGSAMAPGALQWPEVLHSALVEELAERWELRAKVNSIFGMEEVGDRVAGAIRKCIKELRAAQVARKR